MSPLGIVSPRVFIDHAHPILRRGKGIRTNVFLRRFKALLGVTPLVCSVAWKKLSAKLPEKAKPRHLLWALLFLKVYATEHCNRALTGVDEKTFRLWSWRFVYLLASINIVSCNFL